MKRFFNKLTAGLSVLPVLLLPSVSSAQGLGGATSTLGAVGQQLNTNGGTTTSSLPVIIGNLINLILGTMGIVFVILILYAGFLYMGAGTTPDNAKKAKSLILNSVIGLVIIIAAYAIATFIINQLIGATVGAPTTP